MQTMRGLTMSDCLTTVMQQAEQLRLPACGRVGQAGYLIRMKDGMCVPSSAKSTSGQASAFPVP